MDGFRTTAGRLWRTSSYWRYSVCGAVLFTFFSAVHLYEAPSYSSVSPSLVPPIPSLPPPDPASDARLADFQSNFADASKLSKAGEHCEKIAAALELLTSDDLTRGRNVRTSPGTRVRALAEAERCRQSLIISDRHFDALSGSVSAVLPSKTPAMVAAALTALKNLDAFDQSRSRFDRDIGTIANAQNLAREDAASSSRIEAFAKSATAYQQVESAASARQAADALGTLQPYDKAKVASTQPAALQAAEDAARRVREGTARLARVLSLLEVAQARQTVADRRALIDAITSLSLFDVELALPEETSRLAQAQQLAHKELWDLVRERLQELDRHQTPANYQAVADLRPKLATTTAQGELTSDEKVMVSAVQRAADKLAESDGRLTALRAAATKWKTDGVAAAPEVMKSLSSIEDLDHQRFHQAESDAWDTLQAASSVIHGPDIGLNAKTKGQITIAVRSAGGQKRGPDVASRLASQLKLRGFRIVAERDAALLADVSIHNLSAPQLDYTTGPRVFTSVEATVTAIFTWRYGNLPLLPCEATSVGTDKEDDDPTRAALRTADDAVAACLSDYTNGQSSP